MKSKLVEDLLYVSTHTTRISQFLPKLISPERKVKAEAPGVQHDFGRDRFQEHSWVENFSPLESRLIPTLA